jgi:UDP-GlcNAc3NAcA epimerase
MRVTTVVGNRPQFIKSAPLSLALREAGLEETVVHTGQHWDSAMSGVFFDELDLVQPHHTLDLHTADTEQMRDAIRAAIAADTPDWVVVFGDTNSTLAGAQAARDAAVPIVHIEAGLRSGDLSMPEERNRIAVDQIADLLFAPDERSRDTLLHEGVKGRVEVVGDVMADAARRFAPIALQRSTILDQLGLAPGEYVVATIHREANVRAERLRRIIDGLGRSGQKIVFPAHPRTRAVIAAVEIPLSASIELTDPLGYFDFTALCARAAMIVTDSGGLQKEAYWLGVPCITTRPSTEWVDTVEVGANTLVDDDPERIAAAMRTASVPHERPVLYGDGHTAERIVAVIASLGDTLDRGTP